MNFSPVPEIEGAFVVQVARYDDARGYFQEHWNETKYHECAKLCKQVLLFSLSDALPALAHLTPKPL